MAALKYYEEETEVSRKSIKEIRRIPAKKRESRNWVRQCPHCHKFYEQIIGGNGKLSVYCGELLCFRTMDKLRRRSPKRFREKINLRDCSTEF